MQKETSIRFALETFKCLLLSNPLFRRFSTSFGQLRLNHRKVKNSRNGDSVATFENDKFVWPSVEPDGKLNEIVEEALDDHSDNVDKGASGDVAEPPVNDPGPDDCSEDQSRNRPQFTMSARSSGKGTFIFLYWAIPAGV